MNKRNFLTLTAMLGLCSTNFMFINAASAQVSQEVQQLLDETDALLIEAGEFIPILESYSAICQWLENNLGIEANYKTVHGLVYYRLKASPKIARPQSLEQSEERLKAFKKAHRPR